jgi:hypothetical protein
MGFLQVSQMQATAISNALFTKIQQRVLDLLYGNQNKRFYTNEIMYWHGCRSDNRYMVFQYQV